MNIGYSKGFDINTISLRNINKMKSTERLAEKSGISEDTLKAQIKNSLEMQGAVITFVRKKEIYGCFIFERENNTYKLAYEYMLSEIETNKDKVHNDVLEYIKDTAAWSDVNTIEYIDGTYTVNKSKYYKLFMFIAVLGLIASIYNNHTGMWLIFFPPLFCALTKQWIFTPYENNSEGGITVNAVKKSS